MYGKRNGKGDGPKAHKIMPFSVVRAGEVFLATYISSQHHSNENT